MSEERIKADSDTREPDPLTTEELDTLAGGVMEQFYKHSEEAEK